MLRSLFFVMLCVLLVGPTKSEAQSPRRAFWSSLLIPGWGQHYAGARSSATRFLVLELGLWGGYFGFQHLGNIRRDHYRTFAADRAGAHPAGKDRQYFDDLGFYDSRLAHNQFARREDGIEAELYSNGVDYFWEWENEASRQRYRTLRNDSENAKRQALFATGLIVANHLFAAIHAARGVNMEKQATSAKPRVGVELTTVENRLGVVLRKKF
jgi:hypothetical protein